MKERVWRVVGEDDVDRVVKNASCGDEPWGRDFGREPAATALRRGIGAFADSTPQCSGGWFLSEVTTPRLIPAGGIFNDSVHIVFTNDTPDSLFHYTIDSSIATTNIDYDP